MTKTSIEWATRVWNPTHGCDRVSAGCDNCYAIRFAHRFSGPSGKFEGLTERTDDRIDWTGKIALKPERLAEPFRWKTPERVFVDSMSDLFHADVPTEYIADVFAVMALASQHTFQVLTKRPQRMKRLLNSVDFWAMVAVAASQRRKAAGSGADWPEVSVDPCRPLPNVWLGTSVEDQAAAYRVDWLAKTPAAVRFLSCEPLLGPIDLTRWLRTWPVIEQPSAFGGVIAYGSVPQLDWIIAGGESGPGARPCDPDWIRGLKRQCLDAEIPFFFKQWGGRTPKAGGRILDGRTWDEFPTVAEAAR